MTEGPQDDEPQASPLNGDVLRLIMRAESEPAAWGWLIEHQRHEQEELAWHLVKIQLLESDRSDGVLYKLRLSPETMALAAAVMIFGKAYLEALGRSAGEGTANLPKKAKDLVRNRIRKKGAPDEILIGLENGEAAVVVFTQDLPDEAKIALLDLDVAAPDLRGKLLRWDGEAGEWLAVESRLWSRFLARARGR